MLETYSNRTYFPITAESPLNIPFVEDSLKNQTIFPVQKQSFFNIDSSSTFSFSSDNLHCPQPWRPTSPTYPKKRKSKRTITTEDREKEDGQEIQQILFHSAKSRSSIAVGSVELILQQTPKSSSTGPIPYRPTKHMEYINYNDNASDEDSGEADSIIANADDNNNNNVSTQNSESNPTEMTTRTSSSTTSSIKDKSGFRLVFTSISPGVSSDNMMINSSSSSLQSSMSHSPPPPSMITEVVTPPLRTHNPITMNSPFSTDRRLGREGAEIGLLSFSPPPSNIDTEFIERKNRVKLRTSLELNKIQSSSISSSLGSMMMTKGFQFQSQNRGNFTLSPNNTLMLPKTTSTLHSSPELVDNSKTTTTNNNCIEKEIQFVDILGSSAPEVIDVPSII